MKTKSARFLNEKRIHEIFMNCVFNDRNGKSRMCVEVEGVMSDTYMDVNHLDNHKEEISSFLNELPDKFNTSEGASFLDANKDRHGREWTHIALHIDELIQLGMGIGRVVCLTPHDMWENMPGGVPNYRIN